MLPDFINGLFEILGGLFILNHCRVLRRDKQVKGVSFESVLFFNAWGIWNIFYYPTLGQWWSTLGGALMVAANTYWVYLLCKYRDRTGEPWYAMLLPK